MRESAFSAKRYIGRKFDEVSSGMKRAPYKIERASNSDCAFSILGKATSPREVSAKVLMKLKKLKKAAEDNLKDAGRIAGLDVKRIGRNVRHLDPAVGDDIVQVISTNGDTHLGGDDVDREEGAGRQQEDRGGDPGGRADRARAQTPDGSAANI